ncbi:TonB-dependent receptor plug domain-containing protein [Reichenbachiella ulvae]|uniref:TonB-dependent receptor n=1 Tax=Reichenbachiella ulvae TaxID=2980104 RepID=A0ABT3CQ73_9BACT|nr:TonB-dependent receptor [Reichenbachiella ulvae]MCV9385762.1 TonB-dependent receptor [Reichenbachiella ulvae]
MRSIILIGLVVCSCLSVHAQQDSIWLESVDIVSYRLETFASADKVVQIDSSIQAMHQGNSMAMLLSLASPINIRSYGLGGLSTASIRGTGSNQTAVIWEGLNLQSQMNGSLDLNLIPAFMIDNISIQSGGSASMFGSGAMGGSIQMSSRSQYNSGFDLSLHETIGSFGMNSHGMKTQYATDKLRLGLKGFYKTAENDYSFYNNFNQREETQENAQVRQWATALDFGYRLSDRQELQIKYWYQDNLTHIPRTAAQTETQAIQQDDFHRAVIRWKQKLGTKTQLHYHSGYLRHRLEYDDKVSTHSNSHSSSYINEARVEHRWANWYQLELGANYTYENALTNNYSDLKERNRLAFYFSNAFLIADKLELNLLGRQSLIDGEAAPFLPTLALNYHASNWLNLKAKAARSYRLPTFNDLYWTGASHGNPDLVPEYGYSFDLGYKISPTIEPLSVEYEGTLFYNHIKDWILWVSRGTEGWTPENKEQLWSYGLEQNLKINYSLSTKSSILLSGNYQFVLSTLEEPSQFMPELQTTYTPRHQGNAFLAYRLGSFHTHVNLSYTGKQYSDEGNIEIRALDPYLITDLGLGYQLRLGQKHHLNASLQVKNLFDTSYEVRRAYPMPGINYQFSLVYHFNQKYI